MPTDTRLEQYKRMLANAQERVRIARRVHPAGVKRHMEDVRGWQRVIRRHLRGAKGNPSGATFGSLKVGDTFDFISESPQDSFFEGCRKVSARGYECESGYVMKVGSVKVPVHHVGRAFKPDHSRRKKLADIYGYKDRPHRLLSKDNPAMTRLMPHGRHEKVETKIRRKSSTGEYVVSLYIDNVKQREADYFTTDRADAQATARLMMERGVKSNPGLSDMRRLTKTLPDRRYLVMAFTPGVGREYARVMKSQYADKVVVRMTPDRGHATLFTLKRASAVLSALSPKYKRSWNSITIEDAGPVTFLYP